MKVAVLTIFPALLEAFFSTSLIGKACAKGLCTLETLNIRDFASSPHFQVDDVPYGGGAGMVMKVEPVVAAIRQARQQLPFAKVAVLTPGGTRFTQNIAQELALESELIILCGRYEGIDQRALELEVDLELSLGDFVLMGGEVASMAILEAILRLTPGFVGNADSLTTESFAVTEHGSALLEAPHYTRPPLFEGLAVPEVLTSGDHRKIAQWRHNESLKRTAERRPDLITEGDFASSAKPSTKKR